MESRWGRRTVAILGAVLGVVIVEPAVASAPRVPRVDRVTRVSGALPVASGCQAARRAGEPMLAVDPHDPQRLAVSWIQDWGVGAGTTNPVASSQDGGRSWRRTVISGLSQCTGGAAPGTSDPFISIDGGHGLFLSSLPNYRTCCNDVVTSHSSDGGRRWAPVSVVEDAHAQGNGVDDFDSLVADPTAKGRANLVWASTLTGAQQSIRFARTLDGGATWSSPRQVYAQPPGQFDDLARVAVVKGGLLVVFGDVALSAFGQAQVPQRLLAVRSEDGGQTWSAPVPVATQALSSIADPATGHVLQDRCCIASLGVGRDGSSYVAWSETAGPNDGTIHLVRSADGGRTWGAPTVISRVPAPALLASVAVDADGTVGVSWYDLRRTRPGSPVLSADVWFAASTDRDRGWRSTHVAGPFDLRAAAVTGAGVLGDFEGLAALPDGFGAAFAIADSTTPNGPTSIEYAHIRLAP